MTVVVLDTSILVRLVTREPREMFERAERYIAASLGAGHGFHVEAVAIAETLWVLSGPRLRVPHDVQVAAVRSILALPVVVSGRRTVERALVWFAEGRSDWMDCYLAAVVTSTPDGRIASFDRDFRKFEVAWDEP